MNSIDLTPLYRNSVGFDRLASLLDNARAAEASVSGYPPYNIESLDENRYEITLAVAGFDIVGTVIAHKSGHQLNGQFVRKLVEAHQASQMIKKSA